MHPTWHLLLAILAPVAFGGVTLFLPRKMLRSRTALALAGPAATLVLLGRFIAGHGVGAAVEPIAWMPGLNLNLALHADQLGLFFALLVSAVGLLVTLYARAYFGPDRSSLYRFFPTLHLFMTAMLGMALSDSLMLLLLFWELTSISSFLLIGWDRDQPSSVRNAMQAFMVTGLGGLVMMAGLILLGVHTGQWTFTGLYAIRESLEANSLLTAAFLMIFCGAAAKSAQFPLHFWLPGAMAAPTPVSAYLHSATMVKAGVYLIGRLWPILAAALPMWPRLIVPLGAVTMVYGAFIALQKRDLKQIFAYTTVSQHGLLMCMYGLAAFTYDGQPNLVWDVTQILNHALYKAPLFILAGAIGHVASREITELGGFFWRGTTERIMTVVLLLAAYALAAGPLTVSFTAKEMFFYQIVHAHSVTGNPGFWLLIAAGVATGMFNVAIFVRMAAVLLKKPPRRGIMDAVAPHGNGSADVPHQPPASDRQDETNPQHAAGSGGQTLAEHERHDPGHHPHETGIWPAFLWLPGLIIVAMQYIGGLIPGAYEAMFGWLEPSRYYFEQFPLTWDVKPGLPLWMSMAAIGLGIALAVLPMLRQVFHDPLDHAYPGFYTLVTEKLGPGSFGLVQNGHASWYVAATFLAVIGFFGFSAWVEPTILQWPGGAEPEPLPGLLPSLLVIAVLCTAAVAMSMVSNRVARVLLLGAVGYSSTAVYLLYQAPDLTLTQLSIEIVSLIMFLLVLSLLPKPGKVGRPWMVPRIVLGLVGGAVMGWLVLLSATADRPAMPYVDQTGRPYAHLGEFFLRNSYQAQDLAAVPIDQMPPGVVQRGMDEAAGTVSLHPGGGGGNVVNVILVDFRGFDTLGEITVLALAALGVWTLLRRYQSRGTDDDETADQASGHDGDASAWQAGFDPLAQAQAEQAADRRAGT